MDTKIEQRPRILDETSVYFEKTLRVNLANLNVNPDDMRNVADIGCGLFAEAPALRGVFPKARVVGIDRDIHALSLARRSNWLPAGVEIKSGDLRDPGSLGASPYDVVVIRNPDTYHSSDWSVILDNCRLKLNESGLVIVTCPTDIELEKALSLVEDAGFVVSVYGRNENAVPQSSATVMKDAYLMIAKKAT